MSTPLERITRLLDEGGRFMVELSGQASIDLTPDVIAALAEVQRQTKPHSNPAQLTPGEVHGTNAMRGKGG